MAAGEALTLTDYVPVIETVTIDAGTSTYVWRYSRAGNVLIALYADYDALADGALIPVPDTTDLSGETLYITVTGSRA